MSALQRRTVTSCSSDYHRLLSYRCIVSGGITQFHKHPVLCHFQKLKRLTRIFSPEVIVEVIINEIISAATYEQQKHASGSDKTYAVWKCKIINQGSPKSKRND
jgi:hypothetical protein